MDLFIFFFRFTHVYTPFFSLGNLSLQTLKVLVGLLTHSSHLFIINHIENSTWTCVDMEFIFGCLLQIDEWKKGTTIHAKKSLSAWALRLKIKKKSFKENCLFVSGRDKFILQIDLGHFKTVAAVATQGRYRGTHFVRIYRLAFSRLEGEWFYYKENGEVKVFH